MWMTHPTKSCHFMPSLYAYKCHHSEYISHQLHHLAQITKFKQEQGDQITADCHQNIDHRFSKQVIGVPIKSTRRLLLSKPYNQPDYSLSETSSKINGMEREGTLAGGIKNQGRLGPKLFETMKHKLRNGAKIIQFGSQGKIFRKNFSIKDGEKLLQSSQCNLYTTAGAIAGMLFVSTERVAFCSDRSIKTYFTTGKLLKFQYKVAIPLAKIKGVQESKNMKRPSNNYLELVTVDDFSFWFMDFVNYKKTLRYLHHAIGLDSLSI